MLTRVKCGFFVIVLIGSLVNISFAQRWTVRKANEWYTKQPFLVGANFIPSTAINQLEMWQVDTFDPVTIDRELGYAEGIGMNVMRVFLHNLLWEQDAEGLKKRMNEFLAISDKHHIKIIFVLFDSCWNDEPTVGKQPAPIPGKHNSGWVRGPGSTRVFDSSTWPVLEQYTKDILATFTNDNRILIWDLYNEPSNRGYNDGVIPLLTATFRWAHDVRPNQPITVGWWDNHVPSNQLIFRESDVISFHNYEIAPKLEEQIKELQKRFGRPLICTEYMARPKGSTFQDCLPIFKKYKVGAVNWGLVKGKTNTIFAWDTPVPSGQEPKVWFHDIFRPDGSVYSQEEVNTIKRLATGR